MPLRYGPIEDALHLCVDMQRLFVEATPWHTPWAGRVLPQVVRLVEAAPERSLFTRFIPFASPEAAPGTWQRYYERWQDMTLDRLPAGQTDLVPALERFVPPALQFDKLTYSPWHDGRLAPALIARGVRSLILSGLETEVCVLATLLGAIDHGFRTVLAVDAVCSSADETHDAMQRIYDSRFGMQVEIATVDEILSAWPR